MYEYIQNVCIMGLQLPDNFLEGLILISRMKQVQTLPTSTINHQFYHQGCLEVTFLTFSFIFCDFDLILCNLKNRLLVLPLENCLIGGTADIVLKPMINWVFKNSILVQRGKHCSYMLSRGRVVACRDVSKFFARPAL